MFEKLAPRAPALVLGARIEINGRQATGSKRKPQVANRKPQVASLKPHLSSLRTQDAGLLRFGPIHPLFDARRLVGVHLGEQGGGIGVHHDHVSIFGLQEFSADHAVDH